MAASNMQLLTVTEIIRPESTSAAYGSQPTFFLLSLSELFLLLFSFFGGSSLQVGNEGNSAATGVLT